MKFLFHLVGHKYACILFIDTQKKTFEHNRSHLQPHSPFHNFIFDKKFHLEHYKLIGHLYLSDIQQGW